MTHWTDGIVYDDRGLVPAVVQDAQTREVLMLAYMNAESLQKTLQSGDAWFFSRSRQVLWRKGDTSGHVLVVEQIDYDCDGDTLLLRVHPQGPVCHTGARSCFYRTGWPQDHHREERPAHLFLPTLDRVIAGRSDADSTESYTARLLAAGLDRILRKVGEESGEVIIAAKNEDPEELVGEMADLWYHCLVLLHSAGLTLDDLDRELSRRHKGE